MKFFKIEKINTIQYDICRKIENKLLAAMCIK